MFPGMVTDNQRIDFRETWWLKTIAFNIKSIGDSCKLSFQPILRLDTKLKKSYIFGQ